MRLKKSLGQHILVAEPTAEKIVRTLAPTKDDTVLEIGPGSGKLTRFLAEKAGCVIAVEKDAEMIEALKVPCSKFQNLEIIHSDFLKIDLTYALKHLSTYALFCGNLPYNISTPILFKLRDNKALFSRGIVMLQKEVAMRLIARPEGKDYGILSIMMQVSAKIEKCFDVSFKSFFPPPKVTSTVVKLTFYKDSPYKINDPQLFENIVKLAFGKRRKMIRNTIPKEYLQYLEQAGIKPTERPEEISIERFARLANSIKP